MNYNILNNSWSLTVTGKKLSTAKNKINDEKHETPK